MLIFIYIYINIHIFTYIYIYTVPDTEIMKYVHTTEALEELFDEVHIYVFICIFIYICLYLYICMYINIHIFTYIYIYTVPDTGIMKYVHTTEALDELFDQVRYMDLVLVGRVSESGMYDIYIYIYIFICIYMYIYMYVCIYIYIYMYIWIQYWLVVYLNQVEMCKYT
jgi:hypothetical protein